MKQATRSAAIDALRVFGIFAIIVGHVWDNEPVRLATYSWHVPLFFILSGYLATTARPLAIEVRARYLSLIVPYLSWLLLLSVPWILFLVLKNLLTPGALAKLLYGGAYLTRPFTAFWFVTALFFTTILWRWLEKFGRRAGWTVAVGGLMAAWLWPQVVGASPLSILVAPACLFFVLIGVEFRKWRGFVQFPLITGCALLTLSAAAVWSGLSPPLGIKGGQFGVPIISVFVATGICAGLILVFEVCFRQTTGVVALGITRLAQSALVVVFVHAFILWLLKTPPSGGYTYLAVTTAASWLIGLAVIHSPLSRLLAGQPRIGTTETTDQRLPHRVR